MGLADWYTAWDGSRYEGQPPAAWFSLHPTTFVVASTVPDGVERRSDSLLLGHLETVEWRIDAPVFGQGACDFSTVSVLE